MSEPSTTSTNYLVQRDQVRITATYLAELLGPGQPETVAIELNDDVVPADPAHRTALISTLIGCLFRGQDHGVQVSVSGGTTDAGTVRSLVAAGGKGGRTR